MWSLLRNIATTFGYRTSDELSPEEEKEFIDALNSKEDTDTYILKEFHNCDSQEKEGIITHINGELAVINNEYYFNITPSSNSRFSVNDAVKFTLFQNDVDIIVRNVTKIEKQIEDNDINENDSTITNVISGEITNRSGRSFSVAVNGRNKPIYFNLNKVKSEFIPSPGDLVHLDVNEESCFNSNDSSVTIVKVRPQKTALRIGTITNCDEESGSISNFAHFSNSVCHEGFRPGVGEKVFASLVRSNCENGYKWRAIQIISHHDMIPCSSVFKDKTNSVEDLFRNKQGISISICPKFILKINEELDFSLNVTNKSSSKKVMSIYSCSDTGPSQVSLQYPKSNNIPIDTDEIIEIPFKITANFVGSSFEDFVWDFGDFKILRKIIFEVKSDSPLNIQEPENAFFENCSKKFITAQNIIGKTEGEIMPGRRHALNSVFVPVKIGQYLLPKNIIFAALPDSKIHINDLRLQVEEVLPSLKRGLSHDTYADYMHSLLFLEEIEILRKVAALEIEEASFRKHFEYLILDVPEHSPYTKMFLPGDFVLVSLPWDKEKKMQGIIHQITKSELWLMFSKSFHFDYKEGTHYFTSFVTSRSSLRRMHHAVDLAKKYLGNKWLFPTGVFSRPPQITFEEIEDGLISDVHEKEVLLGQSANNNGMLYDPFFKDNFGRGRGKNNRRGRGGYWNRSGAGCGNYYNVDEYNIHFDTRKAKKINWYNSALNVQQKRSVLRVLCGEARPLPYVIFGPPGTGKTITIVEAILQVHHLLPSSRILVATPTNSAADLVAERLLEYGNLQEGDFLRLLGINYAEQGKLTASLVPYSAMASFKDNNSPCNDGDDIQTFNREQIGQHRIIVSTLGCLGVLYCMGFPRGFFSHIFVDEAGQATEPEIMVPMSFLSLKTGQVVLSGDPLQLGPVVLSKLAGLYGLQDSFLVRLLSRFPYVKDAQGFPNNFGYDPRLVTKLVNNYRSLNGILQLFNSLFYEGDLIPNISDDSSEEAVLLKKLKSFKLSFPVMFHGLRGSSLQEPDSKSWYNPEEVFQVFTYLNRLYLDGVQPDQIGIITPYQLQARKIQSTLEAYNLETPKVGSVEEFQGQEKMIIILSLVRSSDDTDDLLNVNFVTDPRRVNVAISRARALLIIIGDPELLRQNRHWNNILKYCTSNNSYIGCKMSSNYTCN